VAPIALPILALMWLARGFGDPRARRW
jgi:hypothetical protein